MDLKQCIVASSGVSTIDGSLDSDIDDSVSQAEGKNILDLGTTQTSSKRIDSLSSLDSVLVEILSQKDNPERLLHAKRALESYEGSDWEMYQRLPNQTPDKLNGYERVLVARHEGLFDLLILSWSEVESPIHDHPCERCFLMPLCGKMFENRYEKSGDGSLKLIHSLPIPNKEASWIDDDIGYHSVGNGGQELACSLHCYIPGFTRPCTIFDPEAGCCPQVGSTINVRSRAATWSVCQTAQQ
jgi:hypothetical protein